MLTTTQIDFLGVYSTQEPPKSNKQGAKPRKRLWFIWKIRNGYQYFKQEINSAYQTIGDVYFLSAAEFKAAGYAETKILATPVSQLDMSKVKEVEGAPSQKVADLEEEDLLSELSGLLEDEEEEEEIIDLNLSPAEKLEQQLYAEFNLYMTKMDSTKERREAVQAITQILKTKQGIVPEHKHMFTDFAIQLRKAGENNVALQAFEKVKSLAPQDANVYFNLSRINYEIKQYKKAWECANEALKIDKNHEKANQMCYHLKTTIKGDFV